MERRAFLAFWLGMSGVCVILVEGREQGVLCLKSPGSNETTLCSRTCAATWTEGPDGQKSVTALGCHDQEGTECNRRCVTETDGTAGPFTCCCSKRRCNKPASLKGKLRGDLIRCHYYRPGSAKDYTEGTVRGDYEVCHRVHPNAGSAQPRHGVCVYAFVGDVVALNGCMYMDDPNELSSHYCTPPGSKGFTHCRCHSNYCNNLNFSEASAFIHWPNVTTVLPEESTNEPPVPLDTRQGEPQSQQTVYVAVAAVVVITVVIVAILIFVHRRRQSAMVAKRRRLREASLGAAAGGRPGELVPFITTATGDLCRRGEAGGVPDGPIRAAASGCDLFPVECIHKGRFGEVCTGRWTPSTSVGHDESKLGSPPDGAGQETTVCIKYFKVGQKDLFLNEYSVYSLPRVCEHSYVVRCLAADPCCSALEGVAIGNGARHALVFEYHSQGALLSVLKSKSLTWREMRAMALSVAEGVAFLHDAVGTPGSASYKPSVVHRDLNSRNILVKWDMTCAIADMGFAMKMDAPSLHSNEPDTAEKSLRDVGTIRYMAPEVLEGAVNLMDCALSLKQIDVYAMSLVLWELATRCTELHQNEEVPSYRLPFEAEVGLYPSFEQMQVCVARTKQRPMFPHTWEDNQVTRSFKDLLQDCWDMDAEARLTALCVVDRLRGMSLTDCPPDPLPNPYQRPLSETAPITAPTEGVEEADRDSIDGTPGAGGYRRLHQSISVSGATTFTQLSTSASSEPVTPVHGEITHPAGTQERITPPSASRLPVRESVTGEGEVEIATPLTNEESPLMPVA